MCNLRFLYREVLEREELIPRLAYMHSEKTLPAVPSLSEKSVASSMPWR
jgi:hypothetical protein